MVKNTKRTVYPSFIQTHQSMNQKTTYVYTSDSNLLFWKREIIDNQGNISLQFPRILVAALAFGVQRVGLHPTMAYLTLESPQLRSHSLLVPGSRFIAVSNPTFESKAPLTMLARLHILAHTARRNSTSSTGAKAKKVVFPIILIDVECYKFQGILPLW